MTGTVAKMIQLMTSSLFESIVRFLGICMLVKALSLEEFGEYSIIVSIAAITATLVNFGGYNLVMSSQKETKEIYFSEVFVTLLNTFVLISLLTFFSLFYDVSLLIVSVFLSEHFLVSIQGITYSSLLKERKELVLSLVRTSVAILFLLVCAIFSYVESSENVFISLYVAYSFISCAIYIISVIYIDSKKINIVFICINEYQFRLKDGIWFLSSGLARSAFFNIDKVIVGFFFNKEITAIYAITMRIYNALF
ncbi:oligosaccharide flippase family protein, partial [Vibrio mimicus]